MLEVIHIDVYYGMIQVLKDVSLSLANEEIVAILGANGAGKSTLIKTISGELKPRTGEIHFQGRRIDGKEIETIVKIGIVQVPESRRLFPDLTVKQNLIMGAFILGNQKDRIATLTEQVFQMFPVLANRQKQAAGSLSGGEQQMLAIGRGIMADAKVMLLDEPSLGISPILTGAIFEQIVEIYKGGKSILLVEQNVEAALSIAMRAYVFEQGQVVLSGGSGDLLASKEIRKAYLGKD